MTNVLLLTTQNGDYINNELYVYFLLLGFLSLVMAVLTVICLMKVSKRKKTNIAGENSPLLRTPNGVN